VKLPLDRDHEQHRLTWQTLDGIEFQVLVEPARRLTWRGPAALPSTWWATLSRDRRWWVTAECADRQIALVKERHRTLAAALDRMANWLVDSKPQPWLMIVCLALWSELRFWCVDTPPHHTVVLYRRRRWRPERGPGNLGGCLQDSKPIDEVGSPAAYAAAI
jgi:hypothetical protein